MACWEAQKQLRTVLLAGEGGEHHVGGVQGVDVVGRERRPLLALPHRQVWIVHVHHHPLQHSRHDVLVLRTQSQQRFSCKDSWLYNKIFNRLKNQRPASRGLLYVADQECVAEVILAAKKCPVSYTYGHCEVQHASKPSPGDSVIISRKKRQAHMLRWCAVYSEGASDRGAQRCVQATE